MTPKYYRNFQEVLAHLRHEDQEYIPIKVEEEPKETPKEEPKEKPKKGSKKGTSKKNTKKEEK